MAKISIAIIGAGYMAEEHIKALKSLDECSIVGISSRTRNKAIQLATKYNIPIAANSVAELHAKTNANGVVIAVNELSTLEVLTEAMSLDWQILCEKPIGLYPSETRWVEKFAKTRKIDLYVALNRRFYRSTVTAIANVEKDSGSRLVEVHDQEDPDTALAGGRPGEVTNQWMFANSVHLIDYFSIFCRGKLEDIFVKTSPLNRRSRATSALLNFSSGDQGVYTGIWNAAGFWSVKITTEKRLLELRPLERLMEQKYPHRQMRHIANDVSADFKPGLRSQASEFLNALRSAHHNLPSISDYMVTQDLVANIYKNNAVKEI